MSRSVLGVATYNIGPDTDEEALKKLTRLSSNHEIVGGVETGGRKEVVQKLRARGITVVHSPIENQGRNIILLRTDRFVVEDTDWVLMNEARRLGEPGAGPAHRADTYMTVAKVKDKNTRRRYWVCVKHLVASMNIPIRDEEAEEDIQRTCAWLKKHSKAAVFMVGDFNAEPDHPNLRPLRAMLKNVAVEMGKPWPSTHGNRHIDQVWYRDKNWLRPTSQVVLPGNPKDHDAYATRFSAGVRNKVSAALADLTV